MTAEWALPIPRLACVQSQALHTNFAFQPACGLKTPTQLDTQSGNRERGHMVMVSSESREVQCGVGVDLNTKVTQTRLHSHLTLPTLQRITCSLLSTQPSRLTQPLSLHQTNSDFHAQLRIHLGLLWFPEPRDPAESRETAKVGQVKGKSSLHARTAFRHLPSP